MVVMVGYALKVSGNHSLIFALVYVIQMLCYSSSWYNPDFLMVVLRAQGSFILCICIYIINRTLWQGVNHVEPHDDVFVLSIKNTQQENTI